MAAVAMAFPEDCISDYGFSRQSKGMPSPHAWRMKRETWIAQLAVLIATNRRLPAGVPDEEKKEAFDLIMRAQVKIETGWEEPMENSGDTR